MKKRALALSLAAICILLCFTGCSSGNYSKNTSSDSASYEAGYAPSAADEFKSDYGSTGNDGGSYDDAAEADISAEDALTGIGVIPESRKIIRNANLDIETLDFDSSIASLQALVEELGGYVSRADVHVYNDYYSLRNGNYTIRIPAAQFDAFFAKRAELGTISSSNVWTDDVTDQYYDVTSRLESLEIKRVRLLALLENAENMDNIIALETELSNTIYEMERLTGTLRRLDDQISYSTFYIYINEVRVTTEPVVLPKTLGERISQEFKNTLRAIKNFSEDALVWIVGASPVLILLAVFVVVIVISVKKSEASRIRRRQERERKSAESLAQFQAAHAPVPPAPPSPAADSGKKPGSDQPKE